MRFVALNTDRHCFAKLHVDAILYRLNPDIAIWLDENNISHIKILLLKKPKILFFRETDAVLFALTWA